MTPSPRRRPISRLSAGLLFFAAPAAWIIFQQTIGAASYLNCHITRPPWGALAGIAALAACCAAAARCWSIRQRGTDARRFLMTIAAGAGAIFALAALTMTAAILLVPACAR